MFDRIPENPGRVKITPESGGAAYYAKMERADNPVQEGTPINKATLLTDETAALFGFEGNAVPDDLFFKLSESVFAKPVEVYKNSAEISSLAVGTSVFVGINGTPTEFLVAHQGVPQTCIYADSTYDGTFLIAKNIYEKKAWSWQLGTTDYSLSEINAYLNGDFYNSIDDEAKELIKQVNVPYRSGTSGQTIKLLPAKVFLPSVREVQENTNGTYKPSDGGKFSLFNDSANRIALFDDVATSWWTRSGHINSQSNGVWHITESGGSASSGTGANYGIRPVIVMQAGSKVYLDESGNAYFGQKYRTMLFDALGNPYKIDGTNIENTVQLSFGSYRGTDTYGASNPNSLTFDFVPRIVIVTQNDNISLAPSSVGTWGGGFMWTYGAISVKCGDNSNYELVTELNGTTLTWYSEKNSYTQQNSNYTYNYIAIG